MWVMHQYSPTGVAVSWAWSAKRSPDWNASRTPHWRHARSLSITPVASVGNGMPSFHALARTYADTDVAAYVALQDREFALDDGGYTATRHQREVGAGYFDEVSKVVSGGTASTLALEGSTEAAQF